jgi:hypothetical protein
MNFPTFDFDVDIKVALKGGLTLGGLLFMGAAAVGDSMTQPGKFSALYWVGVAGLLIGALLIYSGRHD